MRNRVALVFCVHHKPWLMMSTLITALAQDFQDADLYFVYNTGSGRGRTADVNRQLSPFDDRVREVCRLNRPGVFEVEYENDEALDSGAWYKFIRDGRWKPYDWVLFAGEGTLFARPTLLSAMLSFAGSNPAVQVIASGHEKRRVPKRALLEYVRRDRPPTDVDRAHGQAMADTFGIFSRDPVFRRLFEEWGDDFPVETQYHVPPAGPPSPWLRRFRSAWSRRFGAPSQGTGVRQLPWTIERVIARARMWGPARRPAQRTARVYVGGQLCPVEALTPVTHVHDVGFHRVERPEWFGCATNHLMSRAFLERFNAKLDEFQVWDVLDLPFAGSALEPIWGFIPAWLGFDKWFTDGFHRPRKDFVTYRREDYPPEMATYINRYYQGTLAVGWSGDYLKLLAVAPELARLREQLPSVYFRPPVDASIRATS